MRPFFTFFFCILFLLSRAQSIKAFDSIVLPTVLVGESKILSFNHIFYDQTQEKIIAFTRGDKFTIFKNKEITFNPICNTNGGPDSLTYFINYTDQMDPILFIDNNGFYISNSPDKNKIYFNRKVFSAYRVANPHFRVQANFAVLNSKIFSPLSQGFTLKNNYFPIGIYDLHGKCLKKTGRFPKLYTENSISYFEQRFLAADTLTKKVFVGYEASPEIQVFDSSGKLISKFGQAPKFWSADSIFGIINGYDYILNSNRYLTQSFCFNSINIDYVNQRIYREYSIPEIDTLVPDTELMKLIFNPNKKLCIPISEWEKNEYFNYYYKKTRYQVYDFNFNYIMDMEFDTKSPALMFFMPNNIIGFLEYGFNKEKEVIKFFKVRTVN